MLYNFECSEKLFNELFANVKETRTYNFFDKGDHYSFTMPLAGARKEEVRVLVKDGTQLTVSYEPKEKNPYAQSFTNFWNFKGANLEEVNAELKDGLLTITVPKQKPVQSKVRTVVVN